MRVLSPSVLTACVFQVCEPDGVRSHHGNKLSFRETICLALRNEILIAVYLNNILLLTVLATHSEDQAGTACVLYGGIPAELNEIRV